MFAPTTIPGTIERSEAFRLHSLVLGQLSQTVLNQKKIQPKHPHCGMILYLIAQAQEFATGFGWSYSAHYKCLANLLCCVFGETYLQLRGHLRAELDAFSYPKDKTHEMLYQLFQTLISETDLM